MAALDNLRDKWNSITPRERALVALLGASLVITVFVLVTLAITNRLGAMEKRNDKMRRALEILQEYRIHPRDADAAGPVAIGAEPMKLDTYLINTAKKVGIGEKVPQVTGKGKQTRPNGYFQHPYELQVSALTIEQVRDFLEAIETGSPAVAITALNVKKSFSDPKLLDVRMEVSTYSNPAAAPAAPAAGTGTGTGTGTGGTP